MYIEWAGASLLTCWNILHRLLRQHTARGFLTAEIARRSYLFLSAHQAEQNLARGKLLVYAVEIKLVAFRFNNFLLPLEKLVSCAHTGVFTLD